MTQSNGVPLEACSTLKITSYATATQAQRQRTASTRQWQKGEMWAAKHPPLPSNPSPPPSTIVLWIDVMRCNDWYNTFAGHLSGGAMAGTSAAQTVHDITLQIAAVPPYYAQSAYPSRCRGLTENRLHRGKPSVSKARAVDIGTRGP